MRRVFIITFGTLIGGAAFYVGATTLLGIVGKEPWMSITLFASFILVGILMARLTRKMAQPTFENIPVGELERQGLVIYEKYEATRAFEVEEFEDEGSQYFIELKDGRVMFLIGQYLYDYQPADGRREPKRSRQFPCTEFTLLRHKEHGWVVDLRCAGTVLEPECEAPPFGGDLEPPADGDVITDRSYDEIKRQMMQPSKA